MNEQPKKEETLFIFKELDVNPNTTQRELSSHLNISLGKTNYLLRELILKGFIKAKNFSANPGKLKKIQYYLTKEGMEHKMQLTQHFLKAKENEYNRLKKEWDELVAEKVKKSAVTL